MSSFIVIGFNSANKNAVEAFENSLRRDYNATKWDDNIFSIEAETAKEIMEIKNRFKKNINVKIGWAATEEKILDIIEKMCHDLPKVKPINWN